METKNRAASPRWKSILAERRSALVIFLVGLGGFFLSSILPFIQAARGEPQIEISMKATVVSTIALGFGSLFTFLSKNTLAAFGKPGKPSAISLMVLLGFAALGFAVALFMEKWLAMHGYRFA